MSDLKVTQVRSTIGAKPKQRGTLRALGLGRVGRTHVVPDRPEIRGMLARVPHLVTVEELDTTQDPQDKPRKRSAKHGTQGAQTEAEATS